MRFRSDFITAAEILIHITSAHAITHWAPGTCGRSLSFFNLPVHLQPIVVLHRKNGSFDLLHDQVDGTEIAHAKDAAQLEEFLAIMRKGNLASGLSKDSKGLAQAETVNTHTNGELPDKNHKSFKPFIDNPENWHVERARLHNELIAKQMESARKLSKAINKSEMAKELGGKPVLILMRGNSAAGKSSTLKRASSPLLRKLDAASFADLLAEGSLNPDTQKAQLAAMEEGTTSDMVHEEGSMLNRRIVEQAYKEKLSFIVDKRFGAFSSVESVAKQAHEQGYKVIMIDVDAELDQSAIRLLKRMPGGADPNVPFEAIKSGYEEIRRDRAQIAQSPLIDIYEHVSTSFSPARLVAQKANDAPLEIVDKNLWDVSTHFDPVKVKAHQDELAHVVNLLTSVDPGNYRLAEYLAQHIPELHYEIPRSVNVLDSLIEEVERPLAPIIHISEKDPFVNRVIGKNPEETFTQAQSFMNGISNRLRDSVYEVRKDGGQRDHETLAVALRDHFSTSFPNARIELRNLSKSGSYGFEVVVNGLSLPEQHRIYGDRYWKAHVGETPDTLVISTRDFTKESPGTPVELEDIWLPGFGPSTTDNPKLSPSYVLHKRQNDWDYAHELFYSAQGEHQKDPLVVSFDVKGKASLDIGHKAENMAFSKGFRSDEAQAYAMSARSLLGVVEGYVQDLKNIPSATNFKNFVKGRIEIIERQAKVAKVLAVHAKDIVEKALHGGSSAFEQYATSSKPKDYSAFRLALLKLKDFSNGSKSKPEVAYTAFDSRLKADDLREINFNTQQMRARYGDNWQPMLREELLKLQVLYNEVIAESESILSRCRNLR